MEDINIKDLMNFYIKNSIKIALITVVILLIGFYYIMYMIEPKYSASTTLLLASEQTVITQGDITLNRSLINTYREIIKSNRVLSKTINDLNLEMSEGALRSMIDVSAISTTDVIKITVKADKPRQSYVIANHLSEKFIETVEELYNIENVSVIDKAELPTTAYNINYSRQIVMVLMLGLFTSISLFTIIYVLDDSIKNEKEIEYTMNVPVIGLIPLDKEGKK